MSRSLLVRGAVILGLLGLALFSAFPLKEKVRLGLDLRGGMHLVLGVKTEDAVGAELAKDMERLLSLAAEDGVTGLVPEPESVDARSFTLAGAPRESDGRIAAIIESDAFNTPSGAAAWDWRRVGDRLEFTMTPAYVVEIERMTIRQAHETIDNRVNAFGVAEPVIQPVGDTNRILVQLPDIDDPERVINLLKQTAFLEFRITEQPPGGGAGLPREAILQTYGGNLPADVELLEAAERGGDGRPLYFAVQRRAVVTGRDLKNAVGRLGEFNQPVVGFSLTHDGGQRFGELTSANRGRGLAIVLDKRVSSAPVIEDRITDEGIIRGNFTQKEVDDLSMVLRSGALPAGITILEERTVGPSLGRDSIRQGLRAGLVGAILVVLAMLVVYRLSGVNAIFALALNVVLIFGALAYFDATLTLPGIAGIILTIGMAVDANVLIFERIKEEIRAGRTVKSSIEAGFSKALSSIMDGNITTLIAALFLFQFGTGPIRGFAVTLSIGIFGTLFSAIFVSRWIFDATLGRRERVERISI